VKALGYHLVHYDLNSEDYLHPGRDQIQQSKNIVKQTLAKAPENGNFIVLQHDIIPQSTGTLTEFTLQLVKNKGWKGMLDWITTPALLTRPHDECTSILLRSSRDIE
jgi:hypothetical protein